MTFQCLEQPAGLSENGAWVIDRIADGLRVAVNSTGRVGPRGFGSGMPDVVREYEDFVGRDVGLGTKVERIQEWMEDIERVAARRFTGLEVRMAEEALAWPARFLADKPLHLDAIWLTSLSMGVGANLEKILRRRRALADRMVEARKIGAHGESSPDVVRIYEEEAADAALKITDWVNPKLAVAQSVRVKKLLIKSAKIRFGREVKAVGAIERHTYVRRCDVWPGKLFHAQRVRRFQVEVCTDNSGRIVQMSIYDRDFSKIVPSAFLDGSIVQAVNVLEAALKEIELLNEEKRLWFGRSSRRDPEIDPHVRMPQRQADQ